MNVILISQVRLTVSLQSKHGDQAHHGAGCRGGQGAAGAMAAARVTGRVLLQRQRQEVGEREVRDAPQPRDRLAAPVHASGHPQLCLQMVQRMCGHRLRAPQPNETLAPA